ncbi:MAG: MFS transporter [Bacteroides sp.]|nr:MFS transporter [Bacteroides sp.]MCM1457728.1 MFS transporter [Lachnoclostridium sp.]
MADIIEEITKERLWNRNYVKVWSANFMLFLSFMLLTPLLPLYLKEEFGAGEAAIGAVLSGYTITTLLIRPFSGYFVDNWPRKTVLLISYGAFALFFGGYVLAGSLLAFTIVRTLHGFPFGAATVANSTVAIDVLPSSRRTEGIGFYGLSNNIAMAIGPTIALFIYAAWSNFDFLFVLSLVIACGGWWINSTLRLKPKPTVAERPHMSLDRFILVSGWSEGLTMVCFACSYGVISTYVAIYGKEELGITSGTGVFFMLLAAGLIMSRLTGSVSLRNGNIARNASVGIAVSLFGYLLFAGVHTLVGYYGAALVIGLGNGHMYPAFQNMFINLATHDRRGTANSTLLVSWDVGMGLGVLAGGAIAEIAGFHAAFWTAWAVNACGALFWYAYVKRHFLSHKLR